MWEEPPAEPVPWDRIEAVLALPDFSPEGRQRYHRLDPRLAGFLRQAARTAATLRHAIAVFGNPSKAGGYAADTGNALAERAAGGDLTLLDEILSAAGAMLDDTRHAVAVELERSEPTTAEPGTAGKVAVMADRLSRGLAVFNPADAATVEPGPEEDELDFLQAP